MEPDKAPSSPAAAWELWNLRALWPRASATDLATLKRRRRRIAQYEARALARLAGRPDALLAPGRNFLTRNPELASGLLVTLHMGPYQFLPEPFLARGIRPTVLLNPGAHVRLRDQADQLRDLLNLVTDLDWLPIVEPNFVRRMITALRQQRPVIVFLDGNSGLGGSRQTRDTGLLYQLPGRRILVRTGLARLACRLSCPVHPVVLRWTGEGEISWHREPSRSWQPGDDVEQVTRWLYDWGFGKIRHAPEQWGYWDMLKQSYACFAGGSLISRSLPAAVSQDFQRALTTCLDRAAARVGVELIKQVEVWPGDVLANLSDDCFYSAEGLRTEQLALMYRQPVSLARLVTRFGRDWVRFHVARLCLLDLASLRGV